MQSNTIDNTILTDDIFSENTSILKGIKVHSTHSTTVTPVNSIPNCSGYTPYDSLKMKNNSINTIKQHLQEGVIKESKKIQIKYQPRSKFRPRTQKESKNASHYIRCEDDAELEYPTIYIPQIWASQSDFNIIEVALMDIDKQPHPYSIENKASKKIFDDHALIIKQNEPNILYFRLTNDDFLKGYKAFMIEFIKSKQNEVITKTLIRARKLDQSMLRFIRIYRNEYGQFQRDVDSEEYSCIMTENYGDTTVEHIGPRYGPMCGQEMIFIVFKGRFVKDDLLSVIISEQQTRWSKEIENFTIANNILYFSMPSFPYPTMARVKANITIYLNKQKLHELEYLYISTLDEELIDISLDSITSDMIISMASNAVFSDPITSTSPISSVSTKKSKNKIRKRLNS